MEEADSIFVERTPAQTASLGRLRDLLIRAGFAVPKKPRKEGTLRVYPKKTGEYPLLNPRFFESRTDLDARFDKPCLVFDVHVREQPSSWRDHLRFFPPSAHCNYVDDGKRGASGYTHEGWFVVPLTFQQGEQVDFSFLEQPLDEIRRFLTARPAALSNSP